LLETEGWRYSADTGWKDWDVQIYGNFWWIVKLQNGDGVSRRTQMPHAGAFALAACNHDFLANAVAVSVLLWRPGFHGE
jgi:hypothetical protein